MECRGLRAERGQANYAVSPPICGAIWITALTCSVRYLHLHLRVRITPSGTDPARLVGSSSRARGAEAGGGARCARTG
jgi:hypothetical protein